MDNQLRDKLYSEINSLCNKSSTEIVAILKARVDLKNSFDYMLLLVREACHKEEQQLRIVKAHNPQLGEDFVITNLFNTGYPALIRILERFINEDPIRKEQMYWEKVEQLFNQYKANFSKTLAASRDKERLLNSEIDQYENLMHGLDNFSYRAENEQVKIGQGFYKIMHVKYYRRLYEKLIVRGNREYHLTDVFESAISGGPKDFYHIQVEAFSKYLDWLKEKRSLNEGINRSEKMFYVNHDFKDLVNNLLTIEGFRVNDFLDYHLTKSVESPFNFLQALRKFLLIECSFNEPEIKGTYGFSVSGDLSTPEQINIAYLWVRNKISEEVTRINTDANPELYIAELNEAEYKIICAKLDRVQKYRQNPDILQSKESLEISKIYENLLKDRKINYEREQLKGTDSKLLKFENYFIHENRKLMRFLRSSYQNAKPKEIAIMLCVLEREKLLNERITVGQGRWIESLSNFFGRTDITRQALYKQIQNLSTTTDQQKQLLETHRQSMEKFL